MSYLFKPTSGNTRTGEQNRVNLERFFHIMNEGWFVYMREDTTGFSTNITNITNNDNIAGPFETKKDANTFLNQQVHGNISLGEPKNESSIVNSAENWRYK